MPKKIVEDVLPPKRSIRNIPLPDGKSSEEIKTPVRRERAVKAAVPASVQTPKQKVERSKSQGSGKNYRRTTLWSLVVLCLVILGFALSYLFVGATILVKPKQWTVPILIELEAQKSGGSLEYSLVSVSKEAQREVPATGEEYVEEKASGKITIFNSQGTASQALVANTRFETPAGLIFRIEKPVTVPGTTVKAGKTIPGSITVTVYADKPGPTYNVGLADFTIPGFKGDAKYKTITAKSDPANPIGGGFLGTKKKVGSGDLETAYSGLESELTASLTAEARAQVPETHVFFPGASNISFEKSTATGGEVTTDTSKALVKEKGTLTGVLFEKSRLLAVLSVVFPDDAKSIPVYAKNWDELTFEFKDNSQTKLSLEEPIKFSLEGNLKLSSIVNQPALQSEFISKRRSDFNNILSGISTIERAELRVRPTWATKFPKNPDKIKVEILDQI